MKAWNAVVAVFIVILLVAFVRNSYAYDEGTINVEDEAAQKFEHEKIKLEERNERFDGNELQGSHIVLVSTMDGRITALDVNRGGSLLWTLDADAEPLLAGTFSSHQKMLAGNTLIPSLDGSLFKFEIERSLPRPVLLFADISRIIDDVVVTGGFGNSKTAVDPLTGEIKYRCTLGKCEQRAPKAVSSQTLILSRNTQVARAADLFTGSEKWNLSVGQYTLDLYGPNGSLQSLTSHPVSRVAFHIKPPFGVISALECGRLLWKYRLSSPIARVWQMLNGDLQEISLFDPNNIEALYSFEEGYRKNPRLPHLEAPFYLGFYNAEPYIIPPEEMRLQKKYISNFPLYNSGLIYRHLSLNDLLSIDSFKRKYQENVKGLQTETDSAKQIFSPENCALDEAVLVSSITEVEDVGSKNDDEIYGGWYVYIPVVDFHMLLESAQPKVNTPGIPEESFPVNVGVNMKKGLFSTRWQLGGVLAICIVCSATLFFAIRARQQEFPEDSSEDKSGTSLSVVPAASTISAASGSSSSTISPENSFISKFYEDFEPVKCLGKGGYGVVFKCRHKLDDCHYAVKRITVSNTTSAIERMSREAKAMAKLDHPGVIRYFHTWIEKPPVGWQRIKDKQILEKIRVANSLNSCSITDSSRQSSDINLNVKKNVKDDSLLHFAYKKNSLLAEALPRNSPTERSQPETSTGFSSSWTASERNKDTSSSSGTSSDEEIEESEYQRNYDDNTLSIVFAQETRSLSEGSSSRRKSSSSEPLQPPLVFVTDDADLEAFKKSKDFIYLYIQMELCKEFTLHNWLLNNKNEKDRELNQMRNWFTQLVCAVEYIHEQGLIHRDIKPQNIFFSIGDQEILKIGDLGLVTDLGIEEETKNILAFNKKRHTGNVGTRLYMSPEQLKGQHYNHKVDVFSLGLIFTEMLIPFQTVMERHEVLNGLQTGFLPYTYLQCLPEERNFIHWLTSENPEDRPTCRDVMQCTYLKNEVHSVDSSFRSDRSLRLANSSRPPFKAR